MRSENCGTPDQGCWRRAEGEGHRAGGRGARGKGARGIAEQRAQESGYSRPSASKVDLDGSDPKNIGRGGEKLKSKSHPGVRYP